MHQRLQARVAFQFYTRTYVRDTALHCAAPMLMKNRPGRNCEVILANRGYRHGGGLAYSLRHPVSYLIQTAVVSRVRLSLSLPSCYPPFVNGRVTRTGFALSPQASKHRTHFQMLVEDESGRELLFDVPPVRGKEPVGSAAWLGQHLPSPVSTCARHS